MVDYAQLREANLWGDTPEPDPPMPLSSRALDPMTDDEFEVYSKKYLRRRPEEPELTGLRFNAQSDCFELSFANGMEWTLPRRLLRGFQRATADQLARFTIADGDEVLFEDADEGFSVQELAANFFGMWTFFARLGGSIGGKARTPAKAAASRANGKKGGRPRKPAPAEAAA